MATLDRKRRAPAAIPRRLRVLVAAHSHPEVSKGGAEIAAFDLFRALQAQDGCEAWFLGCDRSLAAERPGAVISQPYSDAEYIYCTGAFDWFKFANPDPRFPSEIERLFLQLRPDVVHFHHYINFGVEIFQHLRRVLPECRIILTLHEYLAICNHFGQMVTTRHLSLCTRSGPAPCHGCFPEHGRADFFLRKRYIDRFFDLVDVFTAPSRFLAERYIAWGIPAAKMVVLDNAMPGWLPGPALPIPATGTLRTGFFGQISTLKGIDVVLDAAAVLEAEGRFDISFDIFGDYRGQPAEFQAAFVAKLAAAGRNVQFHGPYERSQVDRLMRSVHAVLVPSIWWENSPVVIQEALRNRRPIICSDIGGMAEKVRDGVDGFHVPVGNAMALTGLLRRLAADRTDLSALASQMTGLPTHPASLSEYMELYHAPGLARTA